MIGLPEVRQAAARLQGQVLATPCVESRMLSQVAGCQVFLKFENLQYTASFKERGALNKIAQLSDEERARGVLAVSLDRGDTLFALNPDRPLAPSRKTLSSTICAITRVRSTSGRWPARSATMPRAIVCGDDGPSRQPAGSRSVGTRPRPGSRRGSPRRRN